jgi:pyridoxal phosphate enzyme (YggS family)
MLSASSNIAERIQTIRRTLNPGVTLVCVSKFHPVEAIMEAYEAGERDFGESRVQELLMKHEALPKDIRWHMIGHLQTNKVRAIVPFVHLIHSVDSLHLLETINREAERIGRVVNVLLEVHVAREETKSGFTPDEILQMSNFKSQISNLSHIRVCGLMSMATNTDDEAEIRRCFREVANLSKSIQRSCLTAPAVSQASGCSNSKAVLSMGMSDDYLIAQQEGSTMVRIGTTLFGSRS